MNNKKILILLATLVIFINYENYFKKNLDKSYQEINYLKSKINIEKELLELKDVKSSNNSLESNFFPKSESPSISIANIQSYLNDKSKNLCEISSIKWGNLISVDKLWYMKLPLSVSLKCNPTNFNIYLKEVLSNDKIFNIENLNIVKDRKEDFLNISFQLTGYKIK